MDAFVYFHLPQLELYYPKYFPFICVIKAGVHIHKSVYVDRPFRIIVFIVLF